MFLLFSLARLFYGHTSESTENLSSQETINIIDPHQHDKVSACSVIDQYLFKDVGTFLILGGGKSHKVPPGLVLSEINV